MNFQGLYHRLNPMIRFRQPAIYAKLLEKQILQHFPGEDLFCRIEGSGSLPQKLEASAGTRLFQFKGNTYLLGKSQLSRLVSDTCKDEPNIRRRVKDNYIQFEVAVPWEAPVSLLELRDAYFMKKKSIERNELEKSAEQRFDPHVLNVELRTLQSWLMAEVVKIVQLEFKEKHNDFSLVLLAGSSRGPSLGSDLDYVFLYRDGLSDYYENLVKRIDAYLWLMGVESDNLISRFSGCRVQALNVRDCKNYKYVFHLLTEGFPIEQIGNPEVFAVAKGENTAQFSDLSKIFSQSMWVNIDYCMSIIEESNPYAITNPQVELRRFYTAMAIIRYQSGTIYEQAQLAEARCFFERLRSGIWFLYRGGKSAITDADLKPLSTLLGYRDTKELSVLISANKEIVKDFYNRTFQQSPISKWKKHLYRFFGNIEAAVKIALNYLINGNARIVLIPKITAEGKF